MADWPIPISPSQANFNKHEAEKARNWQEMMSATAYQRQMGSMAAAGLNPILAATGGFGAGGVPGAGSGAMVGQGSGDPASALMANRLTSQLTRKAVADTAVSTGLARSASAKATVDELDQSIYTGPDGRALRRGTI